MIFYKLSERKILSDMFLETLLSPSENIAKPKT